MKLAEQENIPPLEGRMEGRTRSNLILRIFLLEFLSLLREFLLRYFAKYIPRFRFSKSKGLEDLFVQEIDREMIRLK